MPEQRDGLPGVSEARFNQVRVVRPAAEVHHDPLLLDERSRGAARTDPSTAPLRGLRVESPVGLTGRFR